MDTNTMAAVETGANYQEEALLLADAGAVASLVTVTAAHSRRRRSRPRRTWMRCLFQRRQSRGTCEVLVRELSDEDPELFRAYLQMDVATYDQQRMTRCYLHGYVSESLIKPLSQIYSA